MVTIYRYRVKGIRIHMETSTLGGRLKYVREQRLGLSLAKMAERLTEEGIREGGTSPSVMRYENGERMPGADYVAIMARIGGVDAGWLLTGEGVETPATPEEARRALQEIGLLVERYRAGIGKGRPTEWDETAERASSTPPAGGGGLRANGNPK